MLELRSPRGTHSPTLRKSQDGSPVSQRIESLFQRAAERDKERPLASTDIPPDTGGSRVNELVSSFEQLSSSPPRKRREDATLARINRLKTTAANVVDVQAIEEEVKIPSDITHFPMDDEFSTPREDSSGLEPIPAVDEKPIPIPTPEAEVDADAEAIPLRSPPISISLDNLVPGLVSGK